MALMDEFREEREAIKSAPFKKRLEYFWDYYKWYVIVPVVILIFVGNSIYQKVTAPEVLVSGVCLNTYNMAVDEATDKISEDFTTEKGLDPKDYEVNLNTNLTFMPNDTSGTANYESAQALMAWIASGSIDFLSGEYETMEEFCYKGYFEDLRNVFTEEQLTMLEPYILYMDKDVEITRQLAIEKQEEFSEIELPDCNNPEAMGDPVPMMIDVSKCETFAPIYATTKNGLAIGFAVNGPHPEMTLEFLEYLLK